MIPHKSESSGRLNLATVDARFAVKPDANGIIHWHISESSFTKDLDKYKQILAFEKGFKIISPYFPRITFESTSKREKAPIELFFKKNGDKDLPEPFDKGVLAYAFLPMGDPMGIQSNVYFNDDLDWTVMHKPSSFSLLKVFVHEVLHALGLHHSPYKNDIMYPSYEPNDNITISGDTIRSIRRLYGRYTKVSTSAKRGVFRNTKRV